MKSSLCLRALLVLLTLIGFCLVSGCGGGSSGVVIKLAPDPVQVQQGGNATVMLTVASRAHANASLQLTVAGLPTGVTAVFDKATLGPTETTAFLTLTTDATALPDTYFGITVTAVEVGSPQATHTLVLTLRVAPPGSPDFSIQINPSGQTLANTVGATTTFNVVVSAQSGFTGSVGLSVFNAPAGISIAGPTPATVQVPPNGVSSFVVNVVGPLAAAQTFDLTVMATSGNLGHAGTATIQIP